MAAQVQYENDLTQGSVWKQLLTLFFPILAGTLFQQLYNMVDTVVVGQFAGKETLAAVGGVTGTLLSIFINFFVGISSGASVVIAQHYGGGQSDLAGKAAHTAVTVATAGGALATLLGLLLAPWALGLMNTPPEVMGEALAYMRICFLGMIPLFLYNMGTGILRAMGDSRRPLYFLAAACLLNVALDLLLVAGLGWGAAGAAVATVVSQVLSTVLVLYSLLHIMGPCRIFPSRLRITGSLCRAILLVGIPAGLQSNMYTFSNTIIQAQINSFGTDAMAAWTVLGKIDSLFWLASGALGLAITIFVGQNFGAQKLDRIRTCARQCSWMLSATAVAISGALFFWGGAIARIFSSDPNVLEITVLFLRCMTPFYFTAVWEEVYAPTVRGTGDSVIPMLLVGGGVCVLRLIWVAVMLPLRRELSTIAVGYPVTWIITSLLFKLYYHKGRWLSRCGKKAGLEGAAG